MFVREDGSAAIGNFSDATMAADESLLLADRAQLLTVTALAVGRERAVRIAAATIGNQALERVLPYLQRAALDAEVWREVKKRDWELEELRVAAEQETGSAPKELEQLRRVTWGSIGKLALIGLVAYALISAVVERRPQHDRRRVPEGRQSVGAGGAASHSARPGPAGVLDDRGQHSTRCDSSRR